VKPRELYEQARHALSLHDYETAKLVTDKLEAALPDHYGVLILSGTISMKRGRFAEAAEKFEKVIALSPDHVEALNNLGVALKHTGDLPGALDYLEQAARLDPDRADICYNIGNCQKQQGAFDEAILSYRKAIELDPDFTLAYNNLGTIYQQLGNTDRAKEVYRQGLDNDANHPTIRYNLGISLENEGKLAEAVEEYRRSLKSKPGWTAGMNNLGVSLQKMGKLEDAENIFRDLVRIAPKEPKGNNNLGAILFQRGNSEEAELFYRKALEADKSYSKAAINLSSLKVESTSPEEAIKEIEKLCLEYPQETGVKLKLVHAFIEGGKIHKAGALLAPIIKEEPDSGEAHCLMGRIRKLQGKKDLAERHFQIALRKDPSIAEPWLHLAYLAKDQGEDEKAMGAVSRYIETKGSSIEGSLLLANLLMRRNLYTEAQELLLELNEKSPGNSGILTYLVDVSRLMGNQADAVKYAQELVQLHDADEKDQSLHNLEKTLDLYDQVTGEYAEERERDWQRNLQTLLEDEHKEPEAEESGEMEEESYIDETIPDFGDEEVPIIDVGGIEPVIAVDEEEEELDLRELEEDLFLPEEKEKEEEHQEEPRIAAVSAAGSPAAQAPSDPDRRQESSPPSAHDAGGGKGSEPDSPQGHGGLDSTEPGSAEAPFSPPGGAASPGPPAPHYSSINTQTNAPGLLPIVSPPKIIYRDKKRRETGEEEALPPSQPELEPESGETAEIEPPAESSEPKKEPGHSEKPAHLIAYLEELTQYLPEKERESFESSDMPLRMEALRAKLEGKQGLIKRFARTENPGEGKQHQGPEQLPVKPLEKGDLKKSFAFFDQLASWLPEKEVQISLKQRLARIMKQINGVSR
jgi:tetratricopeptide (TPR) repeat protein